jgi:hypothetical protein
MAPPKKRFPINKLCASCMKTCKQPKTLVVVKCISFALNPNYGKEWQQLDILFPGAEKSKKGRGKGKKTKAREAELKTDVKA